MLNEFIEWAKYVADGQIAGVTEAHVTVGEACGNQSARLDLDTADAVARITCWESGDFVSEIIDFESEADRYSCSGILHSGEPLSQQFKAFFEALGVAIK